MRSTLRVLLIGYPQSKVRSFLERVEECSYINGSETITLEKINSYNPDFIVLHGCHSILNASIVARFPRRIVNLHGAFLPWNRGCHPNLWSFIEGTPKGGSVHFIDENVDQGALIMRREIEVFPEDTLATTYSRVKSLMEDMFIELWPSIRSGDVQTQLLEAHMGTYHSRNDISKVAHLLEKSGWNTRIADLKISQ